MRMLMLSITTGLCPIIQNVDGILVMSVDQTKDYSSVELYKTSLKSYKEGTICLRIWTERFSSKVQGLIQIDQHDLSEGSFIIGTIPGLDCDYFYRGILY